MATQPCPRCGIAPGEKGAHFEKDCKAKNQTCSAPDCGVQGHRQKMHENWKTGHFEGTGYQAVTDTPLAQKPKDTAPRRERPNPKAASSPGGKGGRGRGRGQGSGGGRGRNPSAVPEGPASSSSSSSSSSGAAETRERGHRRGNTTVNCLGCGGVHNEGSCPAKNIVCRKCGETGHFAARCKGEDEGEAGGSKGLIDTGFQDRFASGAQASVSATRRLAKLETTSKMPPIPIWNRESFSHLGGLRPPVKFSDGAIGFIGRWPGHRPPLFVFNTMKGYQVFSEPQVSSVGVSQYLFEDGHWAALPINLKETTIFRCGFDQSTLVALLTGSLRSLLARFSLSYTDAVSPLAVALREIQIPMLANRIVLRTQKVDEELAEWAKYFAYGNKMKLPRKAETPEGDPAFTADHKGISFGNDQDLIYQLEYTMKSGMKVQIVKCKLDCTIPKPVADPMNALAASEGEKEEEEIAPGFERAGLELGDDGNDDDDEKEDQGDTQTAGSGSEPNNDLPPPPRAPKAPPKDGRNKDKQKEVPEEQLPAAPAKRGAASSVAAIPGLVMKARSGKLVKKLATITQQAQIDAWIDQEYADAKEDAEVTRMRHACKDYSLQPEKTTAAFFALYGKMMPQCYANCGFTLPDGAMVFQVKDGQIIELADGGKVIVQNCQRGSQLCHSLASSPEIRATRIHLDQDFPGEEYREAGMMDTLGFEIETDCGERGALKMRLSDGRSITSCYGKMIVASINVDRCALPQIGKERCLCRNMKKRSFINNLMVLRNGRSCRWEELDQGDTFALGVHEFTVTDLLYTPANVKERKVGDLIYWRESTHGVQKRFRCPEVSIGDHVVELKIILGQGSLNEDLELTVQHGQLECQIVMDIFEPFFDKTTCVKGRYGSKRLEELRTGESLINFLGVEGQTVVDKIPRGILPCRKGPNGRWITSSYTEGEMRDTVSIQTQYGQFPSRTGVEVPHLREVFRAAMPAFLAMIMSLILTQATALTIGQSGSYLLTDGGTVCTKLRNGVCFTPTTSVAMDAAEGSQLINIPTTGDILFLFASQQTNPPGYEDYFHGCLGIPSNQVIYGGSVVCAAAKPGLFLPHQLGPGPRGYLRISQGSYNELAALWVTDPDVISQAVYFVTTKMTSALSASVSDCFINPEGSLAFSHGQLVYCKLGSNDMLTTIFICPTNACSLNRLFVPPTIRFDGTVESTCYVGDFPDMPGPITPQSVCRGMLLSTESLCHSPVWRRSAEKQLGAVDCPPVPWEWQEYFVYIGLPFVVLVILFCTYKVVIKRIKYADACCSTSVRTRWSVAWFRSFVKWSIDTISDPPKNVVRRHLVVPFISVHSVAIFVGFVLLSVYAGLANGSVAVQLGVATQTGQFQWMLKSLDVQIVAHGQPKLRTFLSFNVERGTLPAGCNCPNASDVPNIPCGCARFQGTGKYGFCYKGKNQVLCATTQVGPFAACLESIDLRIKAVVERQSPMDMTTFFFDETNTSVGQIQLPLQRCFLLPVGCPGLKEYQLGQCTGQPPVVMDTFQALESSVDALPPSTKSLSVGETWTPRYQFVTDDTLVLPAMETSALLRAGFHLMTSDSVEFTAGGKSFNISLPAHTDTGDLFIDPLFQNSRAVNVTTLYMDLNVSEKARDGLVAIDKMESTDNRTVALMQPISSEWSSVGVSNWTSRIIGNLDQISTPTALCCNTTNQMTADLTGCFQNASLMKGIAASLFGMTCAIATDCNSIYSVRPGELCFTLTSNSSGCRENCEKDPNCIGIFEDQGKCELVFSAIYGKSRNMTIQAFTSGFQSGMISILKKRGITRGYDEVAYEMVPLRKDFFLPEGDYYYRDSRGIEIPVKNWKVSETYLNAAFSPMVQNRPDPAPICIRNFPDSKCCQSEEFLLCLSSFIGDNGMVSTGFQDACKFSQCQGGDMRQLPTGQPCQKYGNTIAMMLSVPVWLDTWFCPLLMNSNPIELRGWRAIIPGLAIGLNNVFGGQSEKMGRFLLFSREITGILRIPVAIGSSLVSLGLTLVFWGFIIGITMAVWFCLKGKREAKKVAEKVVPPLKTVSWGVS